MKRKAEETGVKTGAFALSHLELEFLMSRPDGQQGGDLKQHHRAGEGSRGEANPP